MFAKSEKIGGLFKCILIILPILLIFISLTTGSYSIGPVDVLCLLYEKLFHLEGTVTEMSENLFWTIRFPRVLSSALVGAGLAVAGAVFQMVFKNPLASPYTLGVSNGAGFGAALAIVLSLGTVGVQFSSVVFGLISIGITFLLSARSRNLMTALVLAGLLVSALFSSLIALLKLLADPFEKLPQIVFWLMGSLSGSSMSKFLYILPVCAFAFLVLILYRWKINVMSMGDQEAKSFGINIRRDRILVIVMSSILTAMVVSISGIISWVGIVIPHLARLSVGPDFRKILPVSISYGICYLVVIDDLCRSLTSSEIPIGVVTGIIGAPLFMLFILRKKVDW